MGKHQLESILAQADLTAPGAALYVPALSGHLLGWGITVPADAATGWAKGALFMHTDLTGETDALYSNIGSGASANFNAVTVAAD
jgi:hypothetical protein